MIPNKGNVNVIEGGTFTDEDYEMGIDLNSLPFLQEQLSNLYTEIELAVVREYSTNARDEHVKRGVTRPIEVTLPTNWKPEFRVRDFGDGLDADDIRDTYSKYGASTTRTTQTGSGMFGFGSKAALAYCGVFTVVSIKNGIKRVVAVRRNEKGIGQMTVVSKDPTDEPSGVEIRVPVSNSRTFVDKANYFYGFWSKGTVLINGSEHIPHTFDEVAPGFYHTKSLGGHSDIIVMGNVPYLLGDDRRLFGWNDGYYSRRQNIVYVNMGDIDFPPSRETVQNTPVSQATIKRVQEEYTQHVAKTVSAEIQTAPSRKDAILAYHKWIKLVPRQAVPTDYHGETIPTDVYNLHHRSWVFNDQYFESQANKNSYVSHHNLATSSHLFVEGKKLDGGITQVTKKKVAKYCKDKGLTIQRVLFVEDPTEYAGDKWTADLVEFVSWDTIKAQQVTKPVIAKRATVGTYPIYKRNDYDYRIKQIDDTLPIYWIKSTDADESYGKSGFARKHFLQMVEHDAQLVKVAGNREDKFKRDYPTAVYAYGHAEAEYTRLEKALTKSERLKLTTSYTDDRILTKLDSSKVDDPELKFAIEALKGVAVNAKYTAAREFVTHYASRRSSLVKIQQSDKDIWEDKYPLLTILDSYGRMSSERMKHIYFYLNNYYRENI